MQIADRIKSLETELRPFGATLVAVSKTHSPDVLLEAYQAGQRIFGENKVQELVSKAEILPKDIQWHMIGHLQTKKVKALLPHVTLIHSLDSEKLILTIEKEADKISKPVEGLLQIHIASEESKYGFPPEELMDWLNHFSFKQLKWLKIVGLMGMATFTEDEKKISAEFEALQKLNNKIKEIYDNCRDFKVLSIGMSGDYHLALEKGSTMVRVGSKIFGERKYATT